MKVLVVTCILSLFALCLLVGVAFGQGFGYMGNLIGSKMTVSITGQMMYVCTYRVAGTTQVVNMPQMCPITMQFH